MSSDFFVEFKISDDDRFRRLHIAFEAIRSAKQSEEWKDDDYWLGFFDSASRSKFWWPSPQELEDWAKRWQSTPVPQRFTDPSLQRPWDFGSMIDAFRNGDYDLLDCERVSEQVGRLTFNPHAWPYGGTSCMRALVEAFGHRVTSETEYSQMIEHPMWVKLGLWGLPNRKAAWAFFWISLVSAAGCIAYGFIDPWFFSGSIWMLVALWYIASIRWIDRYGRWT